MNQGEQNSSMDVDLFFLIRIIFYFWLVVKILEITLFTKRKLTIKQRIEKKYLVSHGQMVKNYTPQQIQLMNVTLQNTLKNATLSKPHPKKNKQILSNKKTVNFQINNNIYYDPPGHETQDKTKCEEIESSTTEGKVNDEFFQENQNQDNQKSSIEDQTNEEDALLLYSRRTVVSH